MACLKRIWEEMKLNELGKGKKNVFNKSLFRQQAKHVSKKLSSDLPEIFLRRQTDRQTETDRDREKGRGLVNSYASSAVVVVKQEDLNQSTPLQMFNEKQQIVEPPDPPPRDLLRPKGPQHVALYS